MLSDFRLACRSLLKSPGYTVVALLTLSLGIGVNTSMFSLVDSLLFRSAPFPAADRLFSVVASTPSAETRPYSHVELVEIREKLTAFSSLTTLIRTQYVVSEPGQPAERLPGTMVSEDFFTTFGVAPLLGRPFSAEEHQSGRNQVVLLSHAFWQQRFGGAADVIGRSMRLDGHPITVIGVMPPAFDYRLLWGHTSFWRPLNFTREQIEWRDYRTFDLIGRLPPDVNPARIMAELAPVGVEQAKLFPESYAGIRYRALPLHEALMDDLGRKISWMLLGLSGFVLLIACANLANLQLARATASLRDFAIRAALGATRATLLRQQLTESLLLSIVGGALGLLLATTLNRVLSGQIGSSGLDITLDPAILGITLVVSLLTGVIFGLVPALLASRADVNTALKSQSRGATTGRGHHVLRSLLIVVQVALSLVLLGGAAILQRGFASLLERPSGWDTGRIISATLPIPETRAEYDTESKRTVLFRRIEERLRQIPGVEHAALATSLPIFSHNADRQVFTDGQSQGDANLPAAFHVMVSSDYFATLGIPLVEGRLFAPEVKINDPRVIILSESFARRLFPNDTAVGKRIASMDSGKPYWAEVIGVVRDVDSAASTRDPSTPYQAYKPLAQEPWGYVYLILRSPAPGSLGETLRRTISEVDPDLAAASVGTVRQNVDQEFHNIRIVAQLLAAFAGLGLLLAAIGIYGVISNLVAQRTGEFGIRLALGATPNNVLALVLGHGLKLTLIGLGLGLGGAYLLARGLNSLMPRLAEADITALLGVAFLLAAVATLSCWLPARRATKVNPNEALRAE